MISITRILWFHHLGRNPSDKDSILEDINKPKKGGCKMPKGDGTGPAGHGLRDGSDRKAGGRGQQGGQKGQGAKTGG